MKALLASLVFTSLLACSSKSSLPNDVGDQAAAGKADGVSAVTREEVDEPLYSSRLRKKACSAIGSSASGDQCDEFDFTVVEVARSNFYLHADDADPITMQLLVAGYDTRTGAEYELALTRQVTSELSLEFLAEVRSSTTADTHRYIEDIADEAGEYPDWWDGEWAGRVSPSAMAATPSGVRDIFDTTLERHREMIQDWDPNAGAFFADDPVFEILREGEVVGYILEIWDSVDHPLWDGSGTHYYFDVHGILVDTVDWTG